MFIKHILSCFFMPKIEAVVFDLEGTVVDVEAAHHQAHILSAKDVGLNLTIDDFFRYIPHFIGGPDEKVAQEISELAAQRGISSDPAYVFQQKRTHYPELLAQLEIRPRPGFVELFRSFSAMDLKYAIGSLTNQEQAILLLERSGVGALFGYEKIVLREHVQNPKPAPDVWIETARRVSVNPDQQVVFEDSPHGIHGAMLVGAYCVGMLVYNRPEIIYKLAQAGAKRIFMHENAAGYKTPPFRATFSAC